MSTLAVRVPCKAYLDQIFHIKGIRITAVRSSQRTHLGASIVDFDRFDHVPHGKAHVRPFDNYENHSRGVLHVVIKHRHR